MRTIKRFFLIISVAMQLVTLNVISQNIQLASSSGSGIETGGKMVRDANGNIYCFGIFTDSIKINNNISGFSTGNFDCYLLKFDRYMNAQWIKTIGGSGAEGAGGIAYSDGKIYVTGWYGAQTIINNDTLIYSLDCIAPGFIASLDTNGSFIQAKSFTKTSNSISCYINAIEVKQNTIVVAGKIKGQFDFGNNQNINTYLTGTEHDAFIARFDTAFNCNLALTAASTYGGQRGEDGANTIQIDNSGNIYVAGYFGSIPSLGNAVLYFGNQTTTAVGGYGFTDYFVAKVRPNGAVAWLRSSGGTLPDFINYICLENETKLAVAGRYSDNSNVAGIPLPSSIDNYSTFVGTIDSAGLGLSAFRISNEALFQSLKKGDDNYLYAADYNFTAPWPRFKIYKIQTDTGVVAMDSLLLNQTSNNVGDLLPPTANCGDLVINGSFNSILQFHSDTIFSNNYQQNLYDFFYGKYSMNGTLLSTPQINSPITNIFCSNTADINLSSSIVANANEYHWQIIPINAGNISNSGNTATINIDSTFNGQIKIVCYASNFCDVSNISDTLMLSINQAPIIYSISNTGFGAVESNIVNATNFNWYLDNSLLNFANMPIVNCIGDGTYSIIATNASCSDTLASFVSCIISQVTSNNANNILMYPNPASEYINLITNDELIKTITIYDITGKEVKTLSCINSQNLIHVTDLCKGFYTIKIATSQYTVTKKITLD